MQVEEEEDQQRIIEKQRDQEEEKTPVLKPNSSFMGTFHKQTDGGVSTDEDA